MKRRKFMLWCLLAGIILCMPVDGGWMQPATAQPLPGQTDPPPDPFEVTARHRALADSAEQADNEITALANTSVLERDIVAARQRERELREAYAAIAAAEYVRPDRFTRLRDLAVLQSQHFDDLDERAFARLERLSALRATWAERERFWTRWRDALQDDPQYRLVQPEIQQALERIRRVQDRIETVFPPIMALQREIETGRGDVRQIIDGVAALREGRREAMLRRDEPFLFSAQFLSQLDSEIWTRWQPVIALREAAFRAFLWENSILLAAHIIIAIIVVIAARRVRRRVHAEGTWSSVLLYPRAAGVFVSTALVAQYYAFAPPIWDVLMWTFLAGSVALLTTRLVPSKPMRILVYFFAAFYPLFLLAEAAQLPAPLFRLALVIVAAAGVVTFGYLSRRQALKANGLVREWWAFAGAALVWGIVLAIEVAGFYLLARWVLHAALTSALVIFVVVFLVAFARGSIRALLRIEASGRFRFLRNVAIPLAEKLVLLLQIVLIVGAGLTLLDVWELVPSREAAWQSIVGVGFTVAGITITLERVLFAALVLYITLLASWLLRTFIESELAPRWNFDASVVNSIIILVHYALIAIGVLTGLSIMGVHLQNFAIVAGALGIGIGFGLQNIVNNFVSGLILLFERPIRVGDTVVIDGEWGTIKKIGLRSTVVITFDRSEVIVPNADLVSEKVTNWTLSNPVARLIVPVGVAYGSDIERVMVILQEAARAHSAVLDDPPPQVLFMEFGESSLDFELRVWVSEVRFRLEVRSALHAKIDARLREAGIEIPFPQRDLHFRTLDPRVTKELAAADAGQSSGRTTKTDGHTDSGAVPEPDPGKQASDPPAEDNGPR